MKTAYLCPTKEHWIYQVSKFLETTTWKNGCTKILEHLWNDYRENTCLRVNEGKISYCDKEFYESEGYEIRTVELPKEEYCKFHSFMGTEQESKNCTDCLKSEPNKPMKKYRKFKVTSAHPWLREGLEYFEVDTVPSDMHGDNNKVPLKEIIQERPTWFEEVESRWKPEIGYTVYIINNDGEIYSDTWHGDRLQEKCWEFGTVFVNKKEAEEARDKVRSLLLSLNN